jgi:hypothetical protein
MSAAIEVVNLRREFAVHSTLRAGQRRGDRPSTMSPSAYRRAACSALSANPGAENRRWHA